MLSLVAAVLTTSLLGSPLDDISVPDRSGAARVRANDLEVDDLQLERAYWSDTAHVGLFGPGWGTAFDVRLSLAEDGSVEVDDATSCRSCGIPFPELSPEHLAHSLAAAAAILARAPPSDVAESLALLATEVVWNTDVRRVVWESEVAAFRRAIAGPRAAALDSGRRERRVVALQNGFVRYEPGGPVEEFDASGTLVRIIDREGVVTVLERDAEGRLERVVDALGRSIAFDYGPEGFVVEARAGEQVARYGYDDQARLAWSVAPERSPIAYAYDGPSARLVSMTDDPRSVSILYDATDGNRARAVVENGENREEWAWTSRALVTETGDVRETTVVHREIWGRDPQLAQARTCTWRESVDRPLGRHATTRRCTSGDLHEEIRYDPWWQAPVAIERDGERIDLARDELGRILTRVDSFGTRSLGYASDGAVASVDVSPAGEEPYRVEYRYRDDGRLHEVEKAGVVRISLLHGANGLPSDIAMVERGRDPVRVRLDYAADGEPRRLELVGVGAVSFGPDADGAPERHVITGETSRVLRTISELLRERDLTHGLD